LFSPLQDLGLIIVDEEHDTSFKQQEGFRYSARDLAVIRAHNESIPLILGSATPSLESLKNAQDGNYRYLKLPQRVGKRAFPGWDIVDKLTNPPLCGFTQPLLERLQSTLDAGQQALVFLNRRGYATAIHCRDCGWTAGCPGCDRPITLHHRPNRLLCHHCGHVQRPNRCCPQCQSPNLEALGQGTERAEQFLQERFSGVPVLRIDRDSLSGKRSMKELIEIVNRNQPCILLGTQMLAKGHHFPAVALVAILDADNGLFSADFRGIERAAQLITQVSGRAGRGDYPGLAILQTEHRDHPMLQKMVTESYADFCEGLLNERKQRSLPPYTAMAILRANSARPQEAESFLAELASVISGSGESIQILGPMPSLIEKRRGRYRYQVQLISTKRSDLHRALETVVESAERLKISRYLRWSIDIDPQIID
jgi:primosomal protein N' (replication factor Y)